MTCHHQSDMFDINGDNKLAAESVEAREAIVRHHSRNPKSLWVCSHSAGKDSQAMLIRLLALVPARQIVVVHADLGEEVEHHGVQEHIKKFTPKAIPIVVCRNEKRSLLDAALLRGKWFSAKARYCTSDFKTSQIDKVIRRLAKERGADTVFNCTGIRSHESKARELKSPLWINSRLTIKTRTVFDYMPIFHYSTDDVYDAIEAAGQHPHPVYGERGSNNERLSCVLCVLGSVKDLRNGAIAHPDKYENYIAIERVIEHTVFVRQKNKLPLPVSIAERTGVPFDELAVQRKVNVMRQRREGLLAKKAQEQALGEEKKAKQGGKGKTTDTQTMALKLA